MLNKYVDAQQTIEKAKIKLHFNKASESVERMVNGQVKKVDDPQSAKNIIKATEESLKDMSEILNYFKDNFLDKDGKIIKVSFWKWIFKKEYRNKIGNAIDFIFDKIKEIASRFIN